MRACVCVDRLLVVQLPQLDGDQIGRSAAETNAVAAQHLAAHVLARGRQLHGLVAHGGREDEVAQVVVDHLRQAVQQVVDDGVLLVIVEVDEAQRPNVGGRRVRALDVGELRVQVVVVVLRQPLRSSGRRAGGRRWTGGRGRSAERKGGVDAVSGDAIRGWRGGGGGGTVGGGRGVDRGLASSVDLRVSVGAVDLAVVLSVGLRTRGG